MQGSLGDTKLYGPGTDVFLPALFIFRILLIFAYVKCHCVQTVLISFHQFLYRLSHESLLYQ